MKGGFYHEETTSQTAIPDGGLTVNSLDYHGFLVPNPWDIGTRRRRACPMFREHGRQFEKR